MSSRKVENLSQIVNAIHPGPKEPGFLAVISVIFMETILRPMAKAN